MTDHAVHPFNLQARAAAAIHGLTALLDPERDGLMYFLGDWRSRPRGADHCLWDCGDGSGRHVDALTLARAMLPSGAPEAAPSHAESQLEAWMWRLLKEDGLSWLPDEPWAAAWSKELLLDAPDEAGAIAEVSWAQRGTLLGLVTRYRATGEDRYRAAGHAMIDGMLRISQRHTDGLYLPEGYYRAGGWHRHEPGSAIGLDEVNAAIIVSALRLYETTAYQPALLLAEGLIRFALKHTPGYGFERGLRGTDIDLLRHFHTRSNFILGVLKLGLGTGRDLGRKEYVAWARQAYDAAKEWGTPFGFFPEGLGQRHGEICCTTDMIEISLLLGRHVDRGYYADAERYGRNHLLESQWLSGERIAAAADRLPPEAEPRHAGAYSTTDDVARRQAGGWASRPGLNDALHNDAPALMQCCNAAGTRGLYDLWRYAVEEQGRDEDRRAFVHLRFSIETPGLRVVSHEPDAGHLTITAREACEVGVRLPEGEQHALLSLPGSDGAVQSLTASRGYVRFRLDAGATADLHYPLREWSATYEVGAGEHRERCWGTWRGETLMRVEPRGAYYPLYEREGVFGPVEPSLPAGPAIESL